MHIYAGLLATPSPDFPLLATILGSTLRIFDTSRINSDESQYAVPEHEIPLDEAFAKNIKTIRFSPPSDDGYQPRVLLASTNTVHIYSSTAQNPPFHASIINAASPSAALHSVAFLSADEVILIPEHAPRITIRNITTGLGVEIRDVKNVEAVATALSRNGSRVRPISIREKSRHIALLTRPSIGKDIVVVLTPPSESDGKPATRTVEFEFALTTADAIGLDFSADGQWLAVWDTPSIANTIGKGNGVQIYTSIGKLYSQWSDNPDPDLSLGVEKAEWLPDGRLAIATIDGRIVILSAQLFQEETTIRHSTVIDSKTDSTEVYVEETGANGERNYAPAVLPAVPPAQTSTNPESLPHGITHLAVSPCGTLLASVCSKTPSTVHITDITPNNICTRAILIHHAAIRSIAWSSTRSGWLMTRTAQARTDNSDAVYIWSESLKCPIFTSVTSTIPERSLESSVSRDSDRASKPSASADSRTASWLTTDGSSDSNTIPSILFPFQHIALGQTATAKQITKMPSSLHPKVTPTKPISSHRLTQKTPICGVGPEDAFDESFENLRAEALAQSISESVTDGGFLPVKFDAMDWTRRQVLGEAGDADDDEDTFVGKGRRK